VVYWDKFDWDEEKGTTPPKKVNKVVFRDNWKGKKLIRYFQPHPPFIKRATPGVDERIRKNTEG